MLYTSKLHIPFTYSFVAGVLTYFIAGALFKYFVRGARGLETIPNVCFWIDLPHLVKVATTSYATLNAWSRCFPFFLVQDGCLLVVSPCYRMYPGYEKL